MEGVNLGVVERKTFAVKLVGVGRKDYSENVEASVEPQIRSYQEKYDHQEYIDVPAGTSVQSEIDIVAKTVVMLYDFYLSCPRNIQLGLLVETYADGVWTPLLIKTGYQTVEVHFTKGEPLFDKYRITVTNPSNEDVTASFNSFGVVTAEDIYYGIYHVVT